MQGRMMEAQADDVHDDAAGEAAEWDARFELWLATAITGHLADQPPPPDSAIAEDARHWAHRLATDGRVRLAAQAGRLLRVAPTIALAVLG